MPTVESMKKDIEALGTSEKEELLQYLEEVFVLASFAAEATNEVNENRFSREKVCPQKQYMYNLCKISADSILTIPLI